MSKFAVIMIGAIAVCIPILLGLKYLPGQPLDQSFANFAPDLFEPTKAIAANQGIYNAFLAAGLFWSLFIRDIKWQKRIATCFLLFVAIAGIFGAMTVSPRIALVQTAPAVVAMALLLLKRKETI